MSSKIQQALKRREQEKEAQQLKEQSREAARVAAEQEAVREREALLAAIDQEGTRLAKRYENADWSTAKLSKARQPRKWWQLTGSLVDIAFLEFDKRSEPDERIWISSDDQLYVSYCYYDNYGGGRWERKRPGQHDRDDMTRLNRLLKRLQRL